MEPAVAGRPWFGALLRGIARLYHPRIAVSHPERLPPDGPVVFVANHPNGMMDPVVMQVAVGRPLRFLAKSTFWDNPVSRQAMESLGVLPAYRSSEADTSNNERTFSRCRDILRNRGWLALFPEGQTHSTPTLLPLKTGAARIALSAEAENGWSLGLRIVPVGLLYADKAIFRSALGVVVGQPIVVGEYEASYEADPKATAAALTARVAEALGEVVLSADDAELWRGILAVATWTAPDGGVDAAARDRRALALADRVRRLASEDPARLNEAVDLTRRFADRMSRIGVSDPFVLDAPEARIFAGIGPLLLLAPLALLGALLAWVPYRLVRVVAVRLSHGDEDVIGTMKVIFGVIFLVPTYLLWAVLGAVVHPLLGLLLAFLGPLSGLAAIRFQERFPWDAAVGWLQSRDTRAQILDDRRQLSALVEAALR